MKKISLFLLAPIFWLSLLNFGQFFSEWSSLGSYISNHLNSVMAQEKQLKLEEFRWGSQNSTGNTVLPRIIYSNFNLVLGEVFDYLTFFSPRIYFQAGDGTKISPNNSEPIAILFVVPWTFGLMKILKDQNKKGFIILIAALPAYLAGQKNFYFLFPVVLSYFWLIDKGLKEMQHRKLFTNITIVYSIFLLLRVYFYG